jgi:hypothetical protein
MIEIEKIYEMSNVYISYNQTSKLFFSIFYLILFTQGFISYIRNVSIDLSILEQYRSTHPVG